MGSALNAAHYILISWPRQSWASNQYKSQGFPSELAAYLSYLQREYRAVTQLIYRRGMEAQTCTVMIMPQNIVAERLPLSEVQQELEELFPITTNAPKSAAWRNSFENRLIVCTHGKRDLCCAKYGYDVYKRISELISFRSTPIDLWECTHVGGDRFAANAIVFPTGHMYGHLRREHSEPLLQAAATGIPFVPCFRGSVFLSGLTQLADAYAHWYCQQNQIAPVFSLDVPEPGINEVARISIHLNDHLTRMSVINLTCVRTTFEVTIDCEQLADGQRRTVKRWVINEVQFTS